MRPAMTPLSAPGKWGCGLFRAQAGVGPPRRRPFGRLPNEIRTRCRLGQGWIYGGALDPRMIRNGVGKLSTGTMQARSCQGRRV